MRPSSSAGPSWRQRQMIRAAIYARFSSDRQNDRSVDDQIASCRELCAREGFAMVQVFSDREMSGAFTVNRPDFQAIVWNRVRMAKDPTTGKRISRPNKA